MVLDIGVTFLLSIKSCMRGDGIQREDVTTKLSLLLQDVYRRAKQLLIAQVLFCLQ